MAISKQPTDFTNPTQAVRFPCPIANVQGKKLKKKCCKKYKKGKRCKRCPNG